MLDVDGRENNQLKGYRLTTRRLGNGTQTQVPCESPLNIGNASTCNATSFLQCLATTVLNLFPRSDKPKFLPIDLPGV